MRYSRYPLLALTLGLSPLALAQAPAVAELDTLVVNASRIAQAIEDTTVPVSVVDRAELDRRQARDLSSTSSPTVLSPTGTASKGGRTALSGWASRMPARTR